MTFCTAASWKSGGYPYLRSKRFTNTRIRADEDPPSLCGNMKALFAPIMVSVSALVGAKHNGLA
jgi:hypothetical protein